MHLGVGKSEFSTNSILKKIFNKGNFEKKHVGKHCSKTKIMWRNIVTIHSVLKKKLWSKIDKDYFSFFKKKIHKKTM